MYRVFRGNVKNLFVETDSLKFAYELAREQEKAGYTVTIKQRKKSRWYLIYKTPEN